MKIEEIKNEIQKLLKRLNKSAKSAKKVFSVCNTIDASWSGSDLVGHSSFFYGDFEVPPHSQRFSIEWGLVNGLPDGWHERSDEDILQKIENDSGVTLKSLDKDADLIADKFEELRKQTIILLSSFSKEAATEIEKFTLKTKTHIFNQYWKRQIVTRDRKALFAGRIIPTHKYHGATALFLMGAAEQLNEFLYLIDKAVAQNQSFERRPQDGDQGRAGYIDKNTLLRLRKIESDDFDLSGLISLCTELDDNYSLENYYSCAMLLRAILDHIPPIFGERNFMDVHAHYGRQSFKDLIKPLVETAKKIGDDYLHRPVSKKFLAVTKTQVSFQANLDVLLNEVAAILESKT